jgi:hypothetical protein
MRKYKRRFDKKNATTSLGKRTVSTDLENDDLDVRLMDAGENAAAEPTAAATRIMERVFMAIFAVLCYIPTAIVACVM